MPEQVFNFTDKEVSDLIRVGFRKKYGVNPDSISVFTQTRTVGYGTMERDEHFVAATIRVTFKPKKNETRANNRKHLPGA